MTTDPKLTAHIADGTSHATTQDIRDIIAAKRAELENAAKHPPTPVKVLPAQLQTASLNVPAAKVAAQTAAAPTPITPQVSDEDLEAFLNGHLSPLIEATEDLVKPPFAFSEVWKLGAIVSATVADALPLAQGVEAGAIVTVVTRFLWRRYGVPLLPAWAQLLGGVLENLIVASIEAAYRFIVKKKTAVVPGDSARARAQAFFAQGGPLPAV